MTYTQLTYLHLATLTPAFFLGTFLLLRAKGTSVHRMLGKLYMGLMLFTAMVTLFMPSQVGPTLFNHFGYLHLLSFLVLRTVPAAYIAARRGKIKAHRRHMIGMYIGSLLLAGSFSFMPGRLMHTWLLS